MGTESVRPTQQNPRLGTETTQPELSLDNGVTVRPWRDGDDLHLLQVLGDPDDLQVSQDRAMLRPSSNEPIWQRSVVAEDNGVPFAAATIFQLPTHPTRLSYYSEVAPMHRREGIATQLLQILEAEAPRCGVRALKARCTKGTAAQCFLKEQGFTMIQKSSQVQINPGALPVPDLENSPLALEDLATGSVELTQVVAEFYEAMHSWDPAEMTLGRAQQHLLAPESGATGAVVLRDTRADGVILAFAISYTGERTDEPADVLVGWNPELTEEDAEEAVRALVGMLAARYPVEVEVDTSMVPLKRVTDELLDANGAELQTECLVYARDAA